MSETLRRATRAAHAAAERSALMRRLLRGELPVATYAELLANLRPIYAGLEAGLARGGARLAPVRIAGLARSAALAADLAGLRAVDAASAPAVLRPAAIAYAARLDALIGTEPVRLAAHAYVRYLGDLAGGQLLRRIVGTRLGAPTGFYEFGDADRVRALTTALRDGLDRVAADAHDEAAIVDEALAAFDRHERLFAELA